MFLNPVWKYSHWTVQWRVLVACSLLSPLLPLAQGTLSFLHECMQSQLSATEPRKSGREQRNTASSQATGWQPQKGSRGLHCCPLFVLALKCRQRRGTLEPTMQVRRRGRQGLPPALPQTKDGGRYAPPSLRKFPSSSVSAAHWCVCIWATISFHHFCMSSLSVSWILWIYWGFLLTLVFRFLPSLFYNSYFCCLNVTHWFSNWSQNIVDLFISQDNTKACEWWVSAIFFIQYFIFYFIFF